MKIKAFSMMELMVSVVAIAIMASVLVPAITQKAKKTDVRVNAEQLTSSCSQFPYCDLCYVDRCVICQRTDCGSYDNVDVEKCVCK